MTARSSKGTDTVAGELRTPRRPSHHPVQPDPDASSVELEAFGENEPTARSTPKAIAEDRQRAATAPGEPPPEVLAAQAYRAHADQVTTQALSRDKLARLRASCIPGDAPKPRRGRR